MNIKKIFCHYVPMYTKGGAIGNRVATSKKGQLCPSKKSTKKYILTSIQTILNVFRM